MRQYRNAVMDNARWQGFEPRPDDIFVCTPSKCGTTWMQNIVANLLWPDGDFPGALFEVCPWIEAKFSPLDVMHRVLAAQTHRRAMKSHMPADAIPWYPQAKYITVGRDGRDAFMSWCNHVSRMKMIDAMAAQAESEGLPVPAKFDGNYRAYFRHWVANENNFFEVVSSYWAIRDRPNLLFAHYNDMKADLEGEMRRVAEFLEIDVPAAKWPQVVERCTFESMRNSKNVADLDRMFEGGVQGFIFKGTNGRWREVLGDEEVELYRKQVAATLSDECARWVEGGRHAIGLR